ncbi:Cof-type HAD-IIB family hydrolase [Lutibacter sp. A80]|uniref:HAD family hydrolase n=1 Tax=Lutibacter sp. A80 TaxID=2918453 RepID=UPI001F06954E|nr:HAD family hydrolase [Lutibacter sp. A80]UMB59958.1 Cof-type HAD-IIB family hydrolase [Lutibacter sp. A80]
MDFSKVKLVVTDMDGTLLNSKHEVSPLFFSIFNKLKQRNIHFVAASGRQYHSIVNKLINIKDDITIIAENGAFAMQGANELFSIGLPKEQILKSIALLRTIKNTNIVLCGKKSAYIDSKDEKFIALFNEYYSEYKIVDDLTKVENDLFFKIAAYHFDSSEKYILPEIKQLENDMQVFVSGKNWLDISHNNANKGYALNILQKDLNITKEETMVFGDYNNDLKMIALADFSYAMQNAHPNVIKAANFLTKTNDQQGVEYILEQILNSRNI